MKTVMNKSAAIYIPSVYGKDIDTVTKTLARWFGGTTNYKTEETWVNEAGELIKEEKTIIRAWYNDKQHIYVLSRMVNLAVEVKDRCKQDCIAIEVEGEMIFV